VLVAIDGPAGAGKSTVARALARELGFAYLDTGAMYRCVALAALEAGGGSVSRLSGSLGALADTIAIDFLSDGSGEGPSRVLLDRHDVSEKVRTPEVSEAASLVAADPEVREALIAKQRALISDGDWVAEGRDIGTVVAPDAELKVYLTADSSERARRRAAELGADVATVLAEQTMRDERDISREHSPLEPASGAVTLDTTGLSVDDVVTRIVVLVGEVS
jgi:cytidylate kinase